MLLRMYARFASRRKIEAETIESRPNPQGGIRGATVLFRGAHGILAPEAGVHRLSRVSPFDKNDRRQTSFASVEVIPSGGERGRVVVSPADVEVSTCRGSGPGGQHRNKVESAVVLRHPATGVVIRCENSRSQHRNRELAMTLLVARLASMAREEEERAKRERRDEAPDAAFGNRHRTYVLSQGRLVHDHRTGRKTPEVERVLDGELELVRVDLKM
jgi:peptide chain release factor 2